MASAVNGILFVCLCVGLVSSIDSFCPGDPKYGYWVEDTNSDRCILRCSGGYEPSGCHVIRYSHREGTWNHDVPSCQEESLISEWSVSGRTLVAVGTGVAAMVAIPVVFHVAGAGFPAATVAADYIMAAVLQTPFTAATKVAVGAVTGAITYVTSSVFSNCEKE